MSLIGSLIDLNRKDLTITHIQISKVKYKEEILKSTRENHQVILKGTPIRVICFSIKTV